MTVHDVTADADTFTCNVFLAPGEVTTLVDAGAMPGVVDAVREHVESLDRVVLTHQHGDHVERLDAVLEAFDPELYAYADHPQRTAALADGDTVQVGDERCEVVYTPGHADDHVSLVGSDSLFSGDVVVHDDGACDDGRCALLECLPDSVEHMYSGHGGVFHGDVRAVVERALERAERREPKYPDE
jgi:glyoxylase-like metal-dependent hydrolase (beta-lactamase superfamily II)